MGVTTFSNSVKQLKTKFKIHSLLNFNITEIVIWKTLLFNNLYKVIIPFSNYAFYTENSVNVHANGESDILVG